MNLLSNPRFLQLFLFLPGLWLCLFAFRLPKKPIWPFLVLALLLLALAGGGFFLHPQCLFAGGGLCLTLFSLFYDDEPFPLIARVSLPYLLFSLICIQFLPLGLTAIFLPAAALALLLWLQKMPLPDILFSLLLLSAFSLIERLDIRLAATLLAAALLLHIHRASVHSMARTTERFQRQLLATQYQEVKEIYLQMRGWRHDYHSHLQTQKAYLEDGKIEALRNYLNLLEKDLTAIDLLVNSANPMVDAIFNSKLSLAKARGIRIDVTVSVLGELPIKDTDLCIIFGNLLDNAIEACEEIPEKDRFIRVYCDSYGQQLYLSVQNSAKEILSFEERHYISTKRGNHGLGMKRVSLLVDHYHGYLNLQNEPGIFAAELTLPLVAAGKVTDDV